jgi:hypothetical protein
VSHDKGGLAWPPLLSLHKDPIRRLVAGACRQRPVAAGTTTMTTRGMSIDVGAAAPCSGVPVGADGAGLLSALTFVSFPSDDSRTTLEVFVWSVVTICDDLSLISHRSVDGHRSFSSHFRSLLSLY